MENGYRMWSFSGIPLAEQPTEKFKQLHWRPRPATLLSKEEQRTVRRNLREYSREFDEIDREMEESADQAVVESRRRLYSEWYSWVHEQKEILAEERAELGKPDPLEEQIKRVRTKSADGTQADEQVIEEVVDEVLEETEEIVA